MNDQRDWNPEQLLQFLQGCHSILGIGWPKPGVPQMAGARIFIGTNPFLALEDGIRQANEEFEFLCKLPKMQTTCEAWCLVKALVAQLRALGRESQSPMIESALNLLYLATGVLYHEISSDLGATPKLVERFSRVEVLEELLRTCAWKQSNSQNPEDILQDVVAEMKKCLVALQEAPKA